MSGVLFLTAALLSATAYDQTFERAVAAYESGDYTQSIELCEQLVAEGVWAPEVFHNLGSAYHRAGHNGAAIANFERALQRDPELEPARVSLAYLLNTSEIAADTRTIPNPGSVGALVTALSRTQTLYSFAVLWCVFWILLFVRLWRPLPYLRGLLVFIAAGAFLMGFAAWRWDHPATHAVAVQPDVRALRVADAKDKEHFTLAEGERVSVERVRDNWIRVKNAQGQLGWVYAESLALVAPPYPRTYVLAQPQEGTL